MLYKSIFSVRAEPKALQGVVPAQRRGQILLYRFLLSNGGVPGVEIHRVGGGSDAGCN